MSAFWHALAFMTRIPVPAFTNRPGDWERSPRFYPLIGLMIGLLIVVASEPLEHLFGAPLAAVCMVGLWIYITGGLHLDGWMDLADGLGSNRSRERMLEIMKDSRVGAMGVLAAIVLLLLKTAAVYTILISKAPLLTLLLIPALARFMMVAAMRKYPYISASGLGTGLQTHLTPFVLGVHGMWISAASVMIFGWYGALWVLAVGASCWLFSRKMVRILGGFTGDGYGALIEWAEIAALMGCVILTRF
ncbi:hypothetical protein SY83_08815 [Paenibacillus swuensis]|uniref:Adenosylcobinamide-GDP ribazoletransferase n=1 Tax=Paenibacillus swuensis TaxID=1178515 RepID=A0A172THV6_9BACL|nr:adenosylcobinamide-GDP ribazoletransferase [Paenibacillus swuensis]ANE46363.1 hypothetical protein SY83_08815 [Paenibacillus swuensis]